MIPLDDTFACFGLHNISTGPSVTQTSKIKFLEQIVEPLWKTSRGNTSLRPPTSNAPVRSIIVEKKRPFIRLSSSPHPAVRAVPARPFIPCSKSSQARVSDESFVKTVDEQKKEESVNTDITGPLRSNIDCMTYVRKRETCRHSYRDLKSVCKCNGSKRLRKSNSKQIQTVEVIKYASIDKSCDIIAPLMEVAATNCDTQVSDHQQLYTIFQRFNSFSDIAKNKGVVNRNHNYVSNIQSVRGVSVGNECRIIEELPRQTSLLSQRELGAPYTAGIRRWALSQYPTRGPDF